MARKILNETSYTFTPLTKTVVIPRYVAQEKLILITNVTTNKVIYNFSDASLKATSYVTAMSGATGTTTIVLNYNTSTMSSTDKLQFTIDEYSEAIRPVEELIDPVGKMRVSNPKSLIDTDFEYGTQITKWENITMIDNRPFAYQQVPNISNLSTITQNTGSRTVVVSTIGAHFVTVNTPLVIQDTYLSIANGNYIVESVPASSPVSVTITGITNSAGTITYATSNTAGLVVGQAITITGASSAAYNLVDAIIASVTTNTNFTVVNAATGSTSFATGAARPCFTYSARSLNTSSVTQILDTNKTAIYQGALYQGAAIGGAPSFSVSGNAVTVTTTVNHGLQLGNEIAVTGVTGTNPPNGSFIVASVLTPTQFVYYVTANPSALTTTGAAIYSRPQGQFLHRPFDGGVIFSSNGNSNLQQAVRQTRRYFRYQSGKAIQVSTGTILKPNLQIEALTSSGTTVTVQTREQHNIQPGASINVFGATETAYNGTFTVTSVLGYNLFTYTANSTPSASPASGSYYAAINTWYGAANRIGMFDQQNGMFWEYDGTTLWAVRRSSTYQLSGKVSVVNGSTTVTQTNAAFPTNFSKQVVVGDYIVIRGVSYRVTDVVSQSQLNISPAYKGTTENYVIVSETQDVRVPQSSFNIDKLDGTGPSGYNIDLSKMQMWYIDYSWYGAGFIRFGLRGTDGNLIYCHKIPNNNVNSEAYMRSGNLPARYESITEPMKTTISASIGSSDTSISVGSTAGFPNTGTLLIRNTAAYEYVNYTGKTATTFTGLTRGQGGQASIALTVALGSNSATVSSTTGLQVGQRIISSAFPENTFIIAISGTTLTLSQAALSANPTVAIPPMGNTAQSFTYSNIVPVPVEFAYPTYAPALSHWGTSVIMDGGFDDDKSLVFTYGQTTPVTIAAGATRSLFAIRLAPSVDNGVGAGFGQREVLNRMQLVLRTLDVIAPANSTLLVRGYLNGTSFAGNQSILGVSTGTAITHASATNTSGVTTYTASAAHGLAVGAQVVVSGHGGTGYNGTFTVASVVSSTQYTVAQPTVSGVPSTGSVIGFSRWTNAVGDVFGTLTSSLAQISDYAPASNGGNAGSYNTVGGEITGGFFTQGVSSIDLDKLRDLGNSVLGGGGIGSPAYSNTNIYPDGPDVLTIVVTNLGAAAVSVLGRLAWTEAQA